MNTQKKTQCNEWIVGIIYAVAVNFFVNAILFASMLVAGFSGVSPKVLLVAMQLIYPLAMYGCVYLCAQYIHQVCLIKNGSKIVNIASISLMLFMLSRIGTHDAWMEFGLASALALGVFYYRSRIYLVEKSA